MTGESSKPAGAWPDAQTVHEALERLYQNVELAGSALATHLPALARIPDLVPRAQATRNLLLNAIEALRPLHPAPPHVLAARSYEVLSLRYVSGLAIEEVAERLAIGERQVYRDLRRAEEELAALLRSQSAAAVPEPASLQEELALVEPTPQWVDLADLLAHAVDTVRPLLGQRQIDLVYSGPQQGVMALVRPGILRQVLVQTLSALAQSLSQETLYLNLHVEDPEADRLIRVLLPRPSPLARLDLLQAAMAMGQSIGVDCSLVHDAAGVRAVTLALRAAQPRPVLIVEDNPGACELYTRYLQDTEWQAIAVRDPRLVEETAVALQPAVIVLDLLMPEIDGWSLLQRLRLDPRTAQIPVIVCSVINDAELAAALGAIASFKKPISRLDLLTALAQATRPRSEA